MTQKEIQAIGQQAIHMVATQYLNSASITFRTSTTSTKDTSLLQVLIANREGMKEKVYTWGELSHNDYQLTDTDLQRMLETFIERSVIDFLGDTQNDLATEAQLQRKSNALGVETAHKQLLPFDKSSALQLANASISGIDNWDNEGGARSEKPSRHLLSRWRGGKRYLVWADEENLQENG
jgi:hypothetical protein